MNASIFPKVSKQQNNKQNNKNIQSKQTNRQISLSSRRKMGISEGVSTLICGSKWRTFTVSPLFGLTADRLAVFCDRLGKQFQETLAIMSSSDEESVQLDTVSTSAVGISNSDNNNSLLITATFTSRAARKALKPLNLLFVKSPVSADEEADYSDHLTGLAARYPLMLVSVPAFPAKTGCKAAELLAVALDLIEQEFSATIRLFEPSNEDMNDVLLWWCQHCAEGEAVGDNQASWSFRMPADIEGVGLMNISLPLAETMTWYRAARKVSPELDLMSFIREHIARSTHIDSSKLRLQQFSTSSLDISAASSRIQVLQMLPSSVVSDLIQRISQMCSNQSRWKQY
ncbi:hypothetical protein GQ42DRAFT_14412 [Ramicandelaber brevisporus]|nr:hypothetical protein GQ42DRAFT_14412 [Ramicandelaber brevisporus]